MKITTLIALRELAVKDLEAATATSEITREQLRQAQELLDQAEADGADEETPGYLSRGRAPSARRPSVRHRQPARGTGRARRPGRP